MSAAIGIVGAGIIGQSWAIAFARGGAKVTLWDAEPGVAAKAREGLASSIAALGGLDLLRGQAPEAVLDRVSLASTLEAAVSGADHVQENAPEDPAVKRALFSRLDAAAPPSAVLASSTSAILPSSFTDGLAGAGRCLVAHPLNPPHLIPSVEIVPGPATDAAALASCRATLAAAGLRPVILSREVPGFLMNRLQGALLDEAMSLVADGVASVEDVDAAMRDGLARRWSLMGPFETIDLNAPGGVAGFLDRYGPAYREIGRDRPHRPDWSGALAARIVAARRAALPEEGLPGRRAWRDAELARLAVHFRDGAS